jgi:hypothetical protein
MPYRSPAVRSATPRTMCVRITAPRTHATCAMYSLVCHHVLDTTEARYRHHAASVAHAGACVRLRNPALCARRISWHHRYIAESACCGTTDANDSAHPVSTIECIQRPRSRHRSVTHACGRRGWCNRLSLTHPLESGRRGLSLAVISQHRLRTDACDRRGHTRRW